MGWFDGWIAYNVLRRRMGRFEERLRRVEYRMATFEEVVTDLAAVTDSIAERIEDAERTNAALRQAVESGDQARAAALASQSEQHANALATAVERLRGLGADSSNPVPDATPVDPAPVDTAPAEGTAPVQGPAETPVDTAPVDAPATPSTTEDGTPVVVDGPAVADQDAGVVTPGTEPSQATPGVVGEADTNQSGTV